MTETLQGALFRKFRDQIMGVIPAQDPGPGKPKPEKASWILTRSSLRKVRQQMEVGFHWRKSGTTGVCWDKLVNGPRTVVRNKNWVQDDSMIREALSPSSHFYQLI
jgi:hypothetical protein